MLPVAIVNVANKWAFIVIFVSYLTSVSHRHVNFRSLYGGKA